MQTNHYVISIPPKGSKETKHFRVYNEDGSFAGMLIKCFDGQVSVLACHHEVKPYTPDNKAEKPTVQY